MLIKHSLPRCVALSILAWICCSTLPVRAQDAAQPAATKSTIPEEDTPAEEPVETLKKRSDQPAAAQVKPQSNASKGDEPAAKPKSNLTDQLLEGLGLSADVASGNPLQAIVERMRDVQNRLQQTETDKPTRELQTQIVKDLDALIEKLKNQKPPPPSPNQNPPPPMGENSADSPPRGSPQPKPQNSQKQRQQSEEQRLAEQKRKQQEQPSTANPPSKGEQARDSDNNRQASRSAAEEAARQRLAKDVWGHLPAALRQELLNVYSEKYLPKYDEMVRKYYEALAEQNRRSP